MSGAGRPDLKGLAPADLRAAVAAAGLPPFRAAQVLDWLYRSGVDDLAAMRNLGAPARERLAQAFTITHLEERAHQAATDGTVKLLWTLPDGEAVETVWLTTEKRRTVCLSTQVGCAFACRFCASGAGALVRNLTAAEIVDQVLGCARRLGARPTNLVYMGMGEPLANYDAVRDSVRILTAPDGYALSPRRITLSTIGYLPGLERLIADALPVKLALSLHAPTDARRAELIPGADRYPLAEVTDALARFRRATKRPVTLEYVLLADTNDAPADADAVAKLANRIGAKVNLIVYNPVPVGGFAAAPDDRTAAFPARLRARGVLTFLRRSGGAEIDGACGQLRRTIAAAPPAP